MLRLPRWLRRRRVKQNIRVIRQHEQDVFQAVRSPDPLEWPVLPDERQIVLTPSASREILIPDSSVSSSTFFTRLPLEIRQQIYTQAFGNKTLHMYLEINYVRGSPRLKEAGERHVGWHWWSIVCHRRPSTAFFHDTCKEGLAPCCLYRGPCPELYFIGVMGWLVSCRSA